MSIPVIYCAACGQGMRRGSAFCPACRHPVGEPVRATPSAHPDPTTQTRRRPGAQIESIDGGQAFGFVFEDPNWILKLLVGGILGLTVVFLPSLLGYLVDTARNVRDGIEQPLPRWSEDFAGRWVRGFGIGFILAFWTFIFMLPVLCTGAGGLVTSPGYAFGNPDEPTPLFIVLTIAFVFTSLVMSIVIPCIYPAIIVHYVNAGYFAAAIEVGAMWRIASRNWKQYLLVGALYGVAGFLGGIGFYLVCIGAIVTLPYSTFVTAHLTGQLAALSVES